MKKFKKIILFALCAVMLLSVVSCSDTQNNCGGNNSNPTLSDSSDYLVKDGASDYKIVTKDNPHVYEKHAASELKKYIEQATKISLPIVSESTVAYGKDSKLLVIGQTEIAQKASVKADKEIYGGRGFIVKKIDTNVFMLGGDVSGTLYSVYEFLHYQFGFEVYDVEEVAIQRNVTNNLLKAYDLSEVPDIPYVNGMGLVYRDTKIIEGHMMRFNVFNEIFINATAQPWHNTFEYVSPREYYSTHPEWFTGEDEQHDQIHYTAHGNTESLKELQDLLFDKFVEAIERDFAKGNYYEYIGFTQQDSVGFFPKDERMDGVEYDENNDSILTLRKKYGDKGANAAMQIQFVNPIAKRLSEYMAEKHPGRTMNIMIMGYEDSDKAPVKFVDGKYQPIDDAVKCEPNVSVLLAPIRNDYIQYAGESGVEITLNEWSAVTDKLALWYHNYYFQNVFIYYDSTYVLQSYYRAAKENKTVYLFNEVPIDNYNGVSFGRLKLYLNSKLGWDVDADVDTLVDNFFDNYYKNASDSMRKMFEELRTHIAMLKATVNFKGICGAGISSFEDEKLWPEPLVNSFMGYIEQAYKDIEPLKTTDYETYEKLYNRITMESLMPRYLSFRFHGIEMYDSDFEFDTAVAKFKADCIALDVKTYDYRGYSIEDAVFSR